MSAPVTRVYIEETSRSAFAVALEWPGWCRRAKTADLAVDSLMDYQDRYADVVSSPFDPGTIKVVATLTGNATTDFGAPDARGPWDVKPLTRAEASRYLGLVEDCWRYFDQVVTTAPSALRKGPRGGGRDRDAVVDHVREAERAYSSRTGAKLPPRTPWPEIREAIIEQLSQGSTNPKWPTRYAIRRLAWHVTDHAWEIQDRSN
ncbi:MAG TPA: hypothetical protein VND83_07325 [Acidimicrobiales bacterium]|nr:hypothetical protein [Acidimicrobiales bacterium]